MWSAPAQAVGVPAIAQVPLGLGSPPLKATLTLPPGAGPFPAVVLVSGSGPNDQDETVGPNKPFLDIALGLAADGIASLRYDKRTLDYPKSVNPRTFTPEDEYVADARTAISLLAHRPQIDHHQIFVLGHSQGGTFAPLIAERARSVVAGVILLAASAEPFGSALVRQVRYLSTLPGAVGSQAGAELPTVEKLGADLDSPALAHDHPGTVLYGGVGPAYYLSLQRYRPVATARAAHQPLLLLQGDRDYQVTVADDLDVWRKGLAGRPG